MTKDPSIYDIAPPDERERESDYRAEIEAKAEQIYLDRYESIGGRWELVEESAKDVWRDHARKMIANGC